jgi:hypothetical protein
MGWGQKKNYERDEILREQNDFGNEKDLIK